MTLLSLVKVVLQENGIVSYSHSSKPSSEPGFQEIMAVVTLLPVPYRLLQMCQRVTE